ncbi:hypothetical protein HGRIS_007876 [Hohenbuehelia grisea]|uniref:Polysaccharide lyase family 8 protein n=1 Tax=Hohenbuehelia grisea TaxID=104357 RepID=A0ABR3J6L7_9AGAR
MKRYLAFLCTLCSLSDILFAGAYGSGHANAHIDGSQFSRHRRIRPSQILGRSAHVGHVSFSSKRVLESLAVSEPIAASNWPVRRATSSQSEQELQIISERRISSIVGGRGRASSIPNWLSTLGSDGKWPNAEVDYTAGCPARRANWPAQEHWQRLNTMAAAWHGGLKGAEHFTKDADLRDAISRAMDFWFDNDFDNASCLDSGGQAACPCGTPGFWNTNWYSNIILIPGLCAQTCLLLGDTLTEHQLNKCTQITGRAYGTFDHNINGVGSLTGANTLDVAKIGIDQGLLTMNESLVADAYRRVHGELVVQHEVKADGIRDDGSFGQHAGVLYNGNYGKVLTNNILDLEIPSAGTQFAADASAKNAFILHLDGDSWMIYRNALTVVNHFDISTIGRMITFPIADDQSSGSIQVNLTAVKTLGEQWESDVLVNFATNLMRDSDTANVAGIFGNRMFYSNDYMVHRGSNYITTLKMYSTRTVNTECLNSQNPLAFHLSDGTVYTYLTGNEYEDIAAAWDWNLVPGTTVDYEATPLKCDNTRLSAIETFVGGTSNGKVGLAAMRYTNPVTRSLRWQKAWFFLEDDVQHVMVAGISSSTDAPVLSVLDQRRHAGNVLIDGSPNPQRGKFTQSEATTLWHAGVGYVLPKSGSAQLGLDIGEKTGDWSKIGTSTQPPVTADLFAAWLEHKDVDTPISYTTLPGVDADSFAQKSQGLQLQDVRNDNSISAVFDKNHSTAMAVFWDSNGGSVTFEPDSPSASITVTVSGNIAMILDIDSGDVTVSDPSQTLATVQVTFTFGPGRRPKGCDPAKSLVFILPSGGLVGSSVTKNLSS